MWNHQLLNNFNGVHMFGLHECDHGLKTLCTPFLKRAYSKFNKSTTERPISTTQKKRRKFRVSTWNQIGDLSHSLEGILIPLKVWGSIPVWELEFFPVFSDYSVWQCSLFRYSWTTTIMIQKNPERFLLKCKKKVYHQSTSASNKRTPNTWTKRIFL